MKYKNLDKALIFKILVSNQEKLRKFGVKKIGLFGSYTKNEQRSSSDIDFFVEFTPGKKNYRNFIQLSFFLEELFDRRVELVTEQSLSPYIGPGIMQEVEYAPI